MSANTLFCGQGGSWPSSPEDSLSQRKLRHMSWQKAPGAYGSDPSVGVGGTGHALHDEVAARRQEGSEKAAGHATAGRLDHGGRRNLHADPNSGGDGDRRLRKSSHPPRRTSPSDTNRKRVRRGKRGKVRI